MYLNPQVLRYFVGESSLPYHHEEDKQLRITTIDRIKGKFGIKFVVMNSESAWSSKPPLLWFMIVARALIHCGTNINEV